jgi:hypothetical protein
MRFHGAPTHFLASCAAHIVVFQLSLLHLHVHIATMPVTCYYPMALSDGLPKIIRRYHYQHGPPPSEPVEFMGALRQGLRSANRPSLWGKMKSVGWRILRGCYFSVKATMNTKGLKGKIDDCLVVYEEPLRLNFPVAPPSSPKIRSRLPDIYIVPPQSPQFKLSPFLPQVEDFLTIPSRIAIKARRSNQKPRPALRPLPIPPSPPPPHATPAISCCSWENGPSPKPPKSQLQLPVSDSIDDDIAAAILYTGIIPFLFPSDAESISHQGADEPQQPNSSDTTDDNEMPQLASAMTLGNTQTQEIRDVAEDAEFLEELGLNTQTFRALLDGVEIQWGADHASQD